MRYSILALLFTPVLVFAQPVYRTVEDGVVSFSDTAPLEGEADVVQLEVSPASDDGLLEERLVAMRETTDRMAADRREREELRLKQSSAQREAAQSSVAAVQPPVWSHNYWPRSGGALRPRPPFRPGYPSRPTQPLQETQAPPGWSVMQPGNAQLMRPVVSGRR